MWGIQADLSERDVIFSSLNNYQSELIPLSTFSHKIAKRFLLIIFSD